VTPCPAAKLDADECGNDGRSAHKAARSAPARATSRKKRTSSHCQVPAALFIYGQYL
jgi:hypothetical protein